jgi:hypothetical protein
MKKPAANIPEESTQQNYRFSSLSKKVGGKYKGVIEKSSNLH